MALQDLSDIDLEKARRRFEQLCCTVSRDIIRAPGPGWDPVVETLTRARRELADEVGRRRDGTAGPRA